MLRDRLRPGSPLANCIVVGIDDGITGQTPWAFVTLLAEKAELSAED